ncbi:hypothetical protein MMC11_002009 [Xylographa trunciseda]|nr:hypothetical protein [Xylographa trunciseda]
MSTTTSLNLPQLILVLLISGLAIRYFFFRPSSSPSATAHPSTSRNSRAANPQHVEQIAQMFPQVGRREIIWDLQRNGGSVAATTERILGRGLEVPPPSFQPPSLASSSPSPPASSSAPSAQPIPQDLITRYNLTSKIQQSPSQPQPSAAEAASEAKKAGWSANKNERQALLQRRREEMILSARRKMEERDRKAV